MLNQGVLPKCCSQSLRLALTTSLFLFCGLAVAQTAPEPTLISYKAPAYQTTAAIQSVHSADSLLPVAPSQHKCFDEKNRSLFSTLGTFSAADFGVPHM